MPRHIQSRSSRDKTAAQLRRRGLRPILIWVPDVSSPEFAAEAHRQSLAIAESEQAAQDQDFVDALSDFTDADTQRD